MKGSTGASLPSLGNVVTYSPSGASPSGSLTLSGMATPALAGTALLKATSVAGTILYIFAFACGCGPVTSSLCQPAGCTTSR